MSSDIEKRAVYDGRIVQARPRYAVEQGALSLTNAPFNAIAATTSQHTYNIFVPSENVFVDRYLRWTSTCFQTFQVTLAAVPAVGESIVVPGRDFSLSAFPLNSLCSTLTATINDTTSVINTQDVLQQVLRLCDKKGNRLVRTCPTMLDKYRSYNDAFGTVNNPIGGEDTATDYDNVPNGAWPNLVFTDASGNPLPLAPTSPAFLGATYDCSGGVPCFNPAGTAPAVGPHAIYIRWQTTEPLVLSPFVFSDVHEYDTGLFGINNIQLIMNFVSSPARLIRSTTRAGRTIDNVAYNISVAGGQVFQNSRLDVQFLTPALSVPLPAKSVVPYMEFPRYISTPASVPANSTLQISSQTITLPQIPDLLIIYAKPAAGYGATDADFLFPVASRVDGVTNPLTVNFDNFSGLLSSHTAEELYAMSVKNGLEMDYASWVGAAHSAAGSYTGSQQGRVVPLVGGPLVIKPSQDLTLQSGQAPSLVGNFTLQFNLTVKNTGSAPADCQLFVITANSGFFESIRGSSRIIKGVLSEQDIIAAAEAPPMTRMSLDRMVGGISFGSLANALSKAKEIYQATKPAISAVKGMLGDEGTMGKVKGALSAVGYGTTGGAMDGCGPSGGARSGGRARKSLAARLM
jgi:hypothetical protein